MSEEQLPTYRIVYKRMLKEAELKNESALARDLGVTPQALSNYKKRDRFPPSLILKFAEKHNASIDYLVYGTSKMPIKTEVEVLEAVLTELDKLGTSEAVYRVINFASQKFNI